MEHAVPAGEGSMAAVIGLDADKIQNAIAGTKAEIANYNCPGQFFFQFFSCILKQRGMKRATYCAKKRNPYGTRSAGRRRLYGSCYRS